MLIRGEKGCQTAIVVPAGNYTENLPTPGYFLGVIILFDRDVAEHIGCGGADDSRRADCCDQLAFPVAASAYSSTGRCSMCNQPSMPAWINTRSGIRKGIRLPIMGSEPAQQMFARKHEGGSDPCKGGIPVVRKAKITRLI